MIKKNSPAGGIFLSNFMYVFLKKFFKFLLEKIFLSDFAKAGKFWYKFESLFMCQNWPYQILGTSFWYLFAFFSSLFENILVISSIFFGNSAFSRAYVTYLVQNIFLNYFLFILCQVKVLTWFVCVLLCLSLWLY